MNAAVRVITDFVHLQQNAKKLQSMHNENLIKPSSNLIKRIQWTYTKLVHTFKIRAYKQLIHDAWY